MKLLTFVSPPDRVALEQVLLNQIKDAIYAYSGILTVAQVIGVLEIARHEILAEQ